MIDDTLLSLRVKHARRTENLTIIDSFSELYLKIVQRVVMQNHHRREIR